MQVGVGEGAQLLCQLRLQSLSSRLWHGTAPAKPPLEPELRASKEVGSVHPNSRHRRRPIAETTALSSPHPHPFVSVAHQAVSVAMLLH